MKNTSSKLLLAFLLASSAGCAANKFNGQEHALTVEQAHPISVDSQTVTMTLAQGSSGLSSLDEARIRAFANSYMNNGHGSLTVTSPTSAGAADVRDALNRFGVPATSVAEAEYRGGATQDVILSYTHYVATPSACGIWEGVRENDYRNMRSPNFGCATQNNLAAMIGDPHDLIAPADMTDPDSATRVRAVNAFRQGKTTSSETDGEVKQQISN